ncbi:hypothetical protein J2Z76_002584 [Sedimentibacter acidaminivorans]|uniref:Uncharacterized protein n=1 Tax=Sedimentibacter acidaminivorans TaxID=913099 RepID=A0ABS4GG90_9FIRM|nr:hypothetical protein [Sedimentibacter acidaminivorans]MBP1926714.1 hypothetical protein [Sedimentibacter acidaminivorans]
MTYQDEVNNTVVGNKKIQSNNILGIYDKATNSFISIEVNEGSNIEIAQGKKSILDACKKLREYEDLNKIEEDKRLTNVFALDKNIIVKAKGVSDKQIFDELDKYNSEVALKENQVKILENNLDKYKKLYDYEFSYKIPSSETLTQWFGDYSNYEPKLGVTEKQINSRLAYFDKVSELITNLIKNDKLIDKFMIIINTKGIEEAYIDDESHKGVTEGAVQFLSRQEQIEKIMSTLITFKDPVIVNSKEELEKLQAEFREAHGEKSHRSEEKEAVRDKKAELLKLMEGQNTRGYIRISHEDYYDVKELIEEMDMPFIAKESGIKVGMNIIVPTDRIQELKNMLLETNKEILQQVEGNIDWNKIKKIQDIRGYGNVNIESLRDFQNMNKDAFKYIAFEKDGKYSVYMEPNCSVIIKGDKLEKKEKNKTSDKKTLKDVNKMKNDYKKSKEEVVTMVNKKNNSRGER